MEAAAAAAAAAEKRRGGKRARSSNDKDEEALATGSGGLLLDGDEEMAALVEGARANLRLRKRCFDTEEEAELDLREVVCAGKEGFAAHGRPSPSPGDESAPHAAVFQDMRHVCTEQPRPHGHRPKQPYSSGGGGGGVSVNGFGARQPAELRQAPGDRECTLVSWDMNSRQTGTVCDELGLQPIEWQHQHQHHGGHMLKSSRPLSQLSTNSSGKPATTAGAPSISPPSSARSRKGKDRVRDSHKRKAQGGEVACPHHQQQQQSELNPAAAEGPSKRRRASAGLSDDDENAAMSEYERSQMLMRRHDMETPDQQIIGAFEGPPADLVSPDTPTVFLTPSPTKRLRHSDDDVDEAASSTAEGANACSPSCQCRSAAACGCCSPCSSSLVAANSSSPSALVAPAEPCHWNILSVEMVLAVFKHLDSQALARCAQVSRTWRRIAYDESLWHIVRVVQRPLSVCALSSLFDRRPRYLRLIDCEFDDEQDEQGRVRPYHELVQLRQNPQLQVLDLTASHLSDPLLNKLLQACPNAVQVDLGNVSGVTHASVSRLPDFCPRVERLCLRMVDNLTDDTVAALARGCRKLRAFSLAWAPHLSLAAANAIAEYCPEMRNLDLSGYREALPDDAVKSLTENCKQLVTLDLSDCYLLTDVAVVHLVHNCQHIEVISLSRCHNITVAAMRVLAQKPSLKAINLFGCYSIVYPHIKEVCSHLAINEHILGEIDGSDISI